MREESALGLLRGLRRRGFFTHLQSWLTRVESPWPFPSWASLLSAQGRFGEGPAMDMKRRCRTAPFLRRGLIPPFMLGRVEVSQVRGGVAPNGRLPRLRSRGRGAHQATGVVVAGLAAGQALSGPGARKLRARAT